MSPLSHAGLPTVHGRTRAVIATLRVHDPSRSSLARHVLFTSSMNVHLRFDRGTVCVDAPEGLARELPHVVWDERTFDFRTPAFRAPDLVASCGTAGIAIGAPWPTDVRVAFRAPSLRSYQDAALTAWITLGERGVVSLPTGAGKTRVAIAAMAQARTPTLVLCPTRALLAQWKKEIELYYEGPVGIVGDGERTVANVTVMTFESAYRSMDTFGDRFGLLIVDEVHHFGSGIRTEALEMCTAPKRLGLTATAPASSSEARRRIDDLVGHVICEVTLDDLLGVHLADLDVVRLFVDLSSEERSRYRSSVNALDHHRRRFFQQAPGADWQHFVSVMVRSDEGRRILGDYQAALRLASFPNAKHERALSLLALHRADKVLVFTANVDDAYALSRSALIPALTAETSRSERDDVLDAFRTGRLRAIVAARVLNEGIDVPDARIAIVVGAAQGPREMVQRIGRVLRPGPDKRALVYELTTSGTIDDYRARARRRSLASGCVALA